MRHCTVQQTDQIFVKGYGFLPFARNTSINISKNLSSKYNQELLDHTKKPATDALQTGSKGGIQKTAGATGNINSNGIADKITRVSKTSSQNTSEENIEHEREIYRQRYIFPDQRQKIIDDLKLI